MVSFSLQTSAFHTRMSVHMIAAKLRCSVFPDGTKGLEQIPDGMKQQSARVMPGWPPPNKYLSNAINRAVGARATLYSLDVFAPNRLPLATSRRNSRPGCRQGCLRYSAGTRRLAFRLQTVVGR